MEKLYKEYNYYMESSTCETAEFKSFARKFKSRIKKAFTQNNLELVNFSKGHFEVSGFAYNPETEHYAYFHVNDMRSGLLGKHPLDTCLVRTAEDEKDFKGGLNNFCKVYKIPEILKRLTK